MTPLEPPRITGGMFIYYVFARTVILCCLVLFIRDPGLRTGGCFVLAYLANANTSHVGGQCQSLFTALRLRAFLQRTRGSRLREVDVESVEQFQWIARVAHVQLPQWRSSRATRWEDSGYALPFKPIRAYVVWNPEGRISTREKTFHTHESTSYLFFRSSPLEGANPFSRYTLLHELGHASPWNMYTPGRKLEFMAEPGVGIAFAFIAGFHPVILGIIACFWLRIILHYRSEGVRLAHELAADVFAYRALDPADLQLLPRLLKVKARHDRGRADRFQRRLAMARLMMARRTVGAIAAGKEIPPMFFAAGRPSSEPHSVAAAIAMFLVPLPSPVPLLPLLALTFGLYLVTVPILLATFHYEKKNVAEIAARSKPMSVEQWRVRWC